MKSEESAVQHFLDIAKKVYLDSITAVLDRLSDGHLLQQLRIEFVRLPNIPQSTAMEKPQVQALVRDETDTLDDLLSYALSTIEYEAMSSATTSDSIPGQFVWLASSDEADRRTGFEIARDVWSAVEKAEETQFTDPTVKQVLRCMPSVHAPFPRGMLLGMKQWEFKFLPPSLAGANMCLWGGWGHSIIIENAANRAKDQQRDSNNNRMSRLRRFEAPVCRKIISGIYERPEVPLDAAVPPNDGSRRERCITMKEFESQGCKSSIPTARLLQITDTAHWPHFTPLGQSISVSAQELLVRSNKADA